VLLSVGLLRQVDGVLVSLQREGYGGYSMNDLGPPLPSGLLAQVNALLDVWQANRDVAYAAFIVYTVLDCVFMGVRPAAA